MIFPNHKSPDSEVQKCHCQSQTIGFVHYALVMRRIKSPVNTGLRMFAVFSLFRQLLQGFGIFLIVSSLLSVMSSVSLTGSYIMDEANCHVQHCVAMLKFSLLSFFF